ncbi:retrovirus-related pol polyprotein from transposon TNT 1-94 [Tanacetum coccineum]
MINCTKINLDNKSANDTLTAELERYKEQVKVLKDGQNVDLKSNDNVLDSSAQSVEIDRLKQTLSEHLKEKESLMQTVTLLKNDFKKEESRNIDREIALEKRIQKPRLNICYEIPDSKRPLLLADEIVRKEQNHCTAITEGSWGFEYTKACFRDEIIPFVKALKYCFTHSIYLINELFQSPKCLSSKEQALETNIVLRGTRVDRNSSKGLIKETEKKRLAHSNYLKHTQEEAAILREIVEQEKSQNPLNESLDSAFAFRQHTCFIRNLEGVYLLTGSRGNNLYTLSLGYMMSSSLICLLSKASKTKSWLWHRRLSHLNFGAINHLARHGLVRGLPKLNFEKDHLCSTCAMGKSKKKPHKPKSEDTNQEKLYLLHMDLCGPMRVASVNGKKYILVIADDYSRFTWVKCLSSKDEAPNFIIKFLKMIQNLGKLQPKADIDFDELTAMASEHSSSGPALHEMTPATITMEEELNEFERLEVWELVPRPDKVMVITLKWIYKVKLDEVRGILKNKARLVTRGYRQEEGINFEESFALVARS